MTEFRSVTARGRRVCRTLLLATAVGLAGLGASLPARADYYDGLTAYQGHDFATAFRELRPLAEQGDARAQMLLGLMYRDGQGVPQDFVRAHLWLNLAAAAGQNDAATARDELTRRMDPGQIAEAQRLAAAWQPGSAAAPTAAPIASTAEAGHGAAGSPAVDAGPLTRAQVTDLQWHLAIHGYDPGPADGVAGARTRAAIRLYQADAGLPVDGEPTLALLDHLRFTRPPVRNTRMVATAGTGTAQPPAARASAPLASVPSYAAGGPAADLASVPPDDSLMRIYVVSVQQALAAKGYRPGPADGLLGPRTREAIRRYQRDYGLPVTGQVSLALLNHLRLVTGFPVGYPASQI
ncbi:MAG: peptidoglycan-binding protein [Pseudomonadota bacterium]